MNTDNKLFADDEFKPVFPPIPHDQKMSVYIHISNCESVYVTNNYFREETEVDDEDA